MDNENFIMPKPKGVTKPRKILWAKPMDKIKEIQAILDTAITVDNDCKEISKAAQIQALIEQEKAEIFKFIVEFCNDYEELEEEALLAKYKKYGIIYTDIVETTEGEVLIKALKKGGE